MSRIGYETNTDPSKCEDEEEGYGIAFVLGLFSLIRNINL